MLYWVDMTNDKDRRDRHLGAKTCTMGNTDVKGIKVVNIFKYGKSILIQLSFTIVMY